MRVVALALHQLSKVDAPGQTGSSLSKLARDIRNWRKIVWKLFGRVRSGSFVGQQQRTTAVHRHRAPRHMNVGKGQTGSRRSQPTPPTERGKSMAFRWARRSSYASVEPQVEPPTMARKVTIWDGAFRLAARVAGMDGTTHERSIARNATLKDPSRQPQLLGKYLARTVRVPLRARTGSLHTAAGATLSSHATTGCQVTYSALTSTTTSTTTHSSTQLPAGRVLAGK